MNYWAPGIFNRGYWALDYWASGSNGLAAGVAVRAQSIMPLTAPYTVTAGQTLGGPSSAGQPFTVQSNTS